MAIDGQIAISFNANDRRSVGLNPSVNIGVSWAPAIGFTDGVGVQQANALYQNSLALTAGANNLDLNGVLTDGYGTLLTPLRVKAWGFQNNSATNSMIVGAAAANPWIGCLNATGTITLPPGAFFLFGTPDATGWAIVPSTGDILKVAGTGTDPFTLAFLAGKT